MPDDADRDGEQLTTKPIGVGTARGVQGHMLGELSYHQNRIENPRSVMSEQSSVSERLGLDYLLKGRSTTPGVADEQGHEARPLELGGRYAAALQAFAADRLLNALHDVSESREIPQGDGIKLSEVADRTQMDAEILVPLSRNLVQDHLLARIKRDPFGNDEVLLTEDAERLISSEDRVAQLIKRLEPPKSLGM